LHSSFIYLMEFLNGGSLEWNLKEKEKYFNEKTIIFYSAQILCGILFLHNKQIVHNDIKLDNVLLNSNGNAKLCDFTLCKKIINSKKEKLFGTLNYKSPESFELLTYPNYSMDYWSFGICIFRMFTNEFPFKDEIIIKDLNIKMPNLNNNNKKISKKYFITKIKQYKTSEIASDFVSRLLNKNLNERLLLVNNIQNNIKNELFFSSIDWNKLENGQIEPPINPKIVRNILFYSF
jgi:novel protein kinase C delta type